MTRILFKEKEKKRMAIRKGEKPRAGQRRDDISDSVYDQEALKGSPFSKRISLCDQEIHTL